MNLGKIRGFIFFLAIFSLIAQASPVRAQTNPTGGEVSGLEGITVTAQKRAESLEDIPMSITALSGEELTDAGVQNTIELTRMSPNVYMRKATLENIVVIRGIVPYDTSLYPACGFYVDDVAMPLHYQHNPDFFDIERVEILRGPQGTLYGRNSESGVINIVTRQPDNEFRGKVMGEYGFYDTNHGDIPSYRTGLNLSGPILEDKFYIAVSGLFDASDGYMQNEFDNSDDAGKYKHKNARASLRWTPADAWDISLTMDVMDYDDKPDYYHFVTGPMASKRNTVNYDYTNSHWDQDSNGQALKVKYKGRLFDLTSVTGHRTYESDSNPEFDCSTLPWPSQTLNYENKFLSQEFRISSKAKSASPFAWLTGVYAYQDETDTHTDFPAMMQARLAEMKFKGLAFFGQGTYTFFDRLHLTGGLRLDYTDAEGAMNLINMGSPSTFDQSFDKTVLLPKLALAYDVSPDIKPYASVSRGYLAGGFSYGFAENKDNFTYDPEYTTNYELGVKTSWLENKLSANLALFRIDMTDRQVSQYVEGAMVGMRKISNVAEAYSQGVELEMRAKPCQGLMLSAGLGLIQAEVKNWVSTQHGPSGIVKEDLSGKRLPNAPSYTYNLGAMYRHDSGFFGRVDLNGVGDMYTDAQNTEITKIESYQLVNLRLGYETESLSLVLWAKNLFDKDYYTVTYAWRDGSVLAGDGAPRSVGLTLTYRF